MTPSPTSPAPAPGTAVPVGDALPVLDAVRRSLELLEDPSGAGTVRARLTLSTTLDLAPGHLWPLLTRPEELARWYGPVLGELREGGSFTVPGGGGGDVLAVQAPHRLDLTWRIGERADPLVLTLDPEDDGTTLLRLVHTPVLDAEVFARFGPGALAVGWEIALLGLAAATDGWTTSCLAPVPVPGPAWLTGPEGADHVRAWSVRWAAAALAAGVDEETARRGERETAIAYGAAPV